MIKRFGKQVVSLAVASVMTVGAFAAPVGYNTASAADLVKVQLLGVNDLHGYMDETVEYDIDGDGTNESVGTLSFMATYMEELEAQNPNTLIVHSGDMIGGSPFNSAYYQDEPIIEIMEEMGFDVGTVGNHEFDEGIAELKRMVEGGTHPEGKGSADYDGMNFPVVAANAFDSSTGELILEPYYIQEIAGQKIGFIGVVTTETPSMVIKTGNENLEITDEVEAINKYVEELKAEGIKSIVVLAHNPVSQDGPAEGSSDAAYIAENIDDEVDVIFAAHNHQVVDRVVNNKLIVQAWEYGKAFSKVDVEIDPATGDIVSKAGEVVYVDQNVEADPEVQAIIDKYNAEVEDVKAEVVGETSVELKGGYASRGESGDNPLGNLIADGMKWSMDADVALMNGGGIRTSIDAGEITYGEAFAVQPFSNINVKFELTGHELIEVLNTQFSSYGPDFSIAGFKYTWNYRNQEVVELFNLDGSAFDLDKTYTVVTNNFMYYRDKYGILEFTDGEPEVGKVDADATVDYIKHLSENGAFEYESEGRISEVYITPGFKDVPERATEFVTFLYNEGIVSGVNETTFDSYREVTRAEFAAMLSRGLGLYAEEKAPFTDISGLNSDMQWDISAAYEAGIVFGETDDTFAPSKSITRDQMAVMLMRAYEYVTEEEYVAEAEAPFKDLDNVNADFQAAIDAAYELGFVVGFDEDTFAPKAATKRIDSASVIASFLRN
ncbi:hypothetical protein GCM10008967_28820 [Bacillus carboniphilus]|uniref:SLH domain-containing protein n=1 Tax=Bacillus carboniphilus TaxID=86663 RepID=A0ABP3G5N3_9BACI